MKIGSLLIPSFFSHFDNFSSRIFLALPAKVFYLKKLFQTFFQKNLSRGSRRSKISKLERERLKLICLLLHSMVLNREEGKQKIQDSP